MNENLTIVDAPLRKRSAPDRQYFVVLPCGNFRFPESYSFSIACGLVERTRGFDWTLSENKNPRCFLELKNHLEALNIQLLRGGLISC